MDCFKGYDKTMITLIDLTHFYLFSCGIPVRWLHTKFFLSPLC